VIVFVCTADHQYTLRDLLEHRGSILNGRFILLSHGEFLSWRHLPMGNYVMADLERLDVSRRRALADRLARLREVMPKARVLNDPLGSLGRVDLLTRLHAEGINRFRIFRADSLPENLTPTPETPVFLRVGEDHVGPRSALLSSREALDRALADLVGAGFARADLVVTEYVDVRNAEGFHERYSVFRVGDRVFSTYYDVSPGWVNKGDNRDFVNIDYALRETAFVRDNPHGELLRPIFDLAGITYGRVDYAFAQDDPEHRCPQIFEINTNPMIETPDRARREWVVAAARFNGLYEDAMAAWAGEEVEPLRSTRPMAVIPGARRHRERSPFGMVRRVLRTFLKVMGALEWETRLTGPLARLRARYRQRVSTTRDGASSLG
jgi:hypothetical protein